MWLDRDARRSKRPWFSEAAHDRIRIEAPTFGLKKAKRRFQNIDGGGPSQCGKIGRDGPVFRGVSRLKWFGHGAEIIAEAAAFGGSDSQSIDCLLHIQSAQPGARRCAA